MKKTHKVITITADFKESAPFFEDSLAPGKLVSHSTYFNPPKKDAIVSHIIFKDCKYLHLYFLSDDKIQQGDWYAWERVWGSGIWELMRAELTLDMTSEHHKKIVATTNRGCWKKASSDYARDRGLIDADAINESFVNVFINSNNDNNHITEVDLLMEAPLRPATRIDDGTVIVSQVKTYSKSDVDELVDALDTCLSHLNGPTNCISNLEYESARKVLAKYK